MVANGYHYINNGNLALLLIIYYNICSQRSYMHFSKELIPFFDVPQISISLANDEACTGDCLLRANNISTLR